MNTRARRPGVAAGLAVAAIGTAFAVAPHAVAAMGQEPVGSCHGKAATITGTDGDDVLTGTTGADVIDAGDGDDQVRGMGGADLICGGDGRDTLTGGVRAGVYGGFGNDVLSGGRVEGSRGFDEISVSLGPLQSTYRIDGGPDYDRLTFVGGAGSSTPVDVGMQLTDRSYTYRQGEAGWSDDVPLLGVETMAMALGDPDTGSLDLSSTRTLETSLSIAGVQSAKLVMGEGRDFVRLDVGHFDVSTNGGFDSVNAVGSDGGGVIRTGGDFDNAFAGNGPTVIYGGEGNDYLGGGPADDVIYGQRDRDFVLGGEGDDRLIGGLDFDGASGGAGTDFCSAEQRFECEE